ncbi:Uma2 family endonuclease [filamentous cyanobacterium Phorm 6]|nr:Uma2 family endonuclease [filamentous cyanobacterium Phorm 6]
MAVQLLKRLFTVEEYHNMSKAGILCEGDRLELIEGELVKMAAIGTRHASSVRRLARLCSQIPENLVIFDVQNPVLLSDRTEPQPDIVLLQPRADYYSTAHPLPSEVLLLIEVADTSIDYDRDVKLPIYARSPIQEIWIVNLQENCLEVYRQPTVNGYSVMLKFWRGDEVSPLAFPEFVVSVDLAIG